MQLFKTPRFFRMLFPNKTWGFSRSDSSVYLTFDDGPDPVVTSWVLDCLKENRIQATFFCVGENVEKHPEVYQRILTENHSVGNHSMKHEKGIKTNFKDYCDSVANARELIDSNLFRPPYGRISFRQTHRLKKTYKIIMWTWLSFDFDSEISIDKILEKAKKQIDSGAIIVVHDNIKSFERLKILLPKLIKVCNDKGLNFKKIS